jgi:hypothetical protein
MSRIASFALVAMAVAPFELASQERAHPQDHERLGTVHFPTSCHSSVTHHFDRGVALLHSFEFGAAIRTFNDVLAADSTCAMAHWGLAMSWWTNPMTASQRPAPVLQRGRASSDAAARLASRASDRERGYIAAVSKLFEDPARLDQAARVAAYERAMRDLVVRQPADTEAKIFHALSLAASA